MLKFLDGHSQYFGCWTWVVGKTESLIDPSSLWCLSQPTGGVFVALKALSCKNSHNSLRKGCFLKFSAISGHGMTCLPWKHFTSSVSQWRQDSNWLDSNVVLVKLHRRDFQDSKLEHTYLDERSTTIMKVVPPGRGCSIALGSGWPLRFPQMWETRRRHFC